MGLLWVVLAIVLIGVLTVAKVVTAAVSGVLFFLLIVFGFLAWLFRGRRRIL